MSAAHPLMPNLFIIGAMKTGTTSLHAYLHLHPEIHMGRHKEPYFFVDQADLADRAPVEARRPVSHDLGAYLANFAGGENKRYRGESSTFYSQYPAFPGVAERVAAASPEARIIYVVREPVSRTISHYWHNTKYHEKRPINEALRTDPIYRDTSDYAMQLEQYLAHFDRDRIHVVVSERMRRNREAVLAEIFDWLGVASFIPDPADLADRNVSPSTSRRERIPGISAVRDSALWQRVRKRLPERLIDTLRLASTKSVAQSEVSDAAVRAELAVYFADRIRRFEAMIGREIPEWRA
jgi:hypothetical protein